MRWSVAALVTALLAPPTQVAIDSSLQTAVERFYAMQESEDIASAARGRYFSGRATAVGP